MVPSEYFSFGDGRLVDGCTTSPFGRVTSLAQQLLVFNAGGTIDITNTSVITADSGTIFATFNGT